MVMDPLNDGQVSMATDSCGGNAVDNRPQSRFFNRQSFPIDSMIPFKKPRFPYFPVGGPKLSIPNKSELCKLFQRGLCHFGENCRFAHEMSAIEMQGFKSVAGNEVSRVRECRFSYRGLDCPYGENCQYLHKCYQNDRVDLGPNRENHAIDVVIGRRNISGSGQIESNSLIACQFFRKSAYYKSKLCMKYERFGSCPYGEHCTYAHGKADIKERGYYSKLEDDHTFESMLYHVQPNNAALCQIGNRAAKKLRVEGKRVFMNWNTENISEIYADWVEMIH